MILELAILDIKPGQEKAFEQDFAKAGQYISSIAGYKGHSLRKCMEKGNRYLLMVDWEDLQSHEMGFRQSEAYLEWKRLLHHYYDPFPTVEHYETVLEQAKIDR